MSNFYLKVCDIKKEIKDIKYDSSLEINLKNHKYVSKITIYDKDMQNDLTAKKFINKYLKLINNEEDDGSMKILDEIEKLKELLIYEYSKYLNKNVYKYFLDNIELLEKSMQNKYNVTIKKGR